MAEPDKLEQKLHVHKVDDWVKEKRSPLPDQSKEGQLGGRLQQVSARALHGQLSCKPVNLKPSCGSSKSVLHNLGLENSTCVADMSFYVRNHGGSVVSDCGDTRPASGTPGYLLDVGDTRQMFFFGQKELCREPNLSASLATFSTKH